MKNRNAIVAVVLIAVIVAASIGYYFTLPPSVTLLMKDPPITNVRFQHNARLDHLQLYSNA